LKHRNLGVGRDKHAPQRVRPPTEPLTVGSRKSTAHTRTRSTDLREVPRKVGAVDAAPLGAAAVELDREEVAVAVDALVRGHGRRAAAPRVFVAHHHRRGGVVDLLLRDDEARRVDARHDRAEPAVVVLARVLRRRRCGAVVATIRGGGAALLERRKQLVVGDVVRAHRDARAAEGAELLARGEVHRLDPLRLAQQRQQHAAYSRDSQLLGRGPHPPRRPFQILSPTTSRSSSTRRKNSNS